MPPVVRRAGQCCVILMEINVYTTTDCSMCKAAKEFLKANGFAYTERNVSEDRQAAKDLIVKTGQRKLPTIDVDGKFVFGFEQDKLEELLGL